MISHLKRCNFVSALEIFGRNAFTEVNPLCHDLCAVESITRSINHITAIIPLLSRKLFVESLKSHNIHGKNSSIFANNRTLTRNFFSATGISSRVRLDLIAKGPQIKRSYFVSQQPFKIISTIIETLLCKWHLAKLQRSHWLSLDSIPGFNKRDIIRSAGV